MLASVPGLMSGKPETRNILSRPARHSKKDVVSLKITVREKNEQAGEARIVFAYTAMKMVRAHDLSSVTARLVEEAAGSRQNAGRQKVMPNLSFRRHWHRKKL